MRTLGKIFLFLIVIVAAAIGYMAWQWKITNEETKAYVDAELPLILKAWDPQELIKRASPEFLAKVKPPEVMEMFPKLALQYGKLVSYDGSNGSSSFSVNVTPAEGKVRTGKCAASATFVNGPADITLTLIKHGSAAWQIMYFDIKPK